jgi:hypothetical protein
VRVHLPRRAAVPDRRGRHAPTFEILGTCPTQHFTRETAPRPPKPGEPSELEYIASRVFGTRDPEAMERIRHGHAVLGAYTNDAGATVMTSGSTDWAHGLAGRDPQIEQITRNVLTQTSPSLNERCQYLASPDRARVVIDSDSQSHLTLCTTLISTSDV